MTTPSASAAVNLEEYTDKELRKKCLYYGLQNIPITDESRQMVVAKLRECIAKQEEKKLALKNRQTLASNQKHNSTVHPTSEKPPVEKFNLTSKQLSSARIVGASVLQELRKQEKIKLKNRAAAAKEPNLLKQKESESSSTPNLPKPSMPLKVIRNRPSLFETFGALKSKDNLALKPKPIEFNKPADKPSPKADKKMKPADIKTMRNLRLVNPKKSKERLNKSLGNIRVESEKNTNLKHNNKSFTVLNAESSVKENIEIITEKLKNLGNGSELTSNTMDFEFDNNLMGDFEESPENLEACLEGETITEEATPFLFPEKDIPETEFSCKEDSDFDDDCLDCLDCLSSDDSPTTERFYSLRYRSYNNISD